MTRITKLMKTLFAALLCVGMTLGTAQPAVADIPAPYFTYIHSVDCNAEKLGDEIWAGASIETYEKHDLKITVIINEVNGGEVHRKTFRKYSALALSIDDYYKYEDGKDYIVYFSFTAGSESTSDSIIVRA